LEPPDRLNAPHVSSIPAGQYLCRRVQSAKYGATLKIMDVPGRTLVRFHPGNRVLDSETGSTAEVTWFQTRCKIVSNRVPDYNSPSVARVWRSAVFRIRRVGSLVIQQKAFGLPRIGEQGNVQAGVSGSRLHEVV
jgi:hypothetical protein